LPPLGECRPDWAVFADVGERLGAPWSFSSAASVLKAINASVPLYADMTYQALRSTGSQWPHVGNDSLYFGGTADANTGGLGLRWSTQAEEGDDALGFGWSELPALYEGDLAAIPTRRLYQSGTLVDRSPTLALRRLRDWAVFNPGDAGRLGLVEGMSFVANINQQRAELTAHLSPETPEGIVLVPSFLRLGPLSITIPKPTDASGRHTGSVDGDSIDD
jgi:predicted molibdopterin-dependent oxidoreductase YjgC